MKKIGLVVVSAILLSSCNQSQKIGFVDNSKLINEYQEKIDLEAQFEKEKKAFQKKNDSLNVAYQAEAEDVQLKYGNAPQATQDEKYQIFGQKWQRIQQQIQMDQAAIQRNYTTQIDSLINNIDAKVEAYGEKNGYTFILGKNEGGSVLYGKAETDITDAVLKELNDSYKK